MKEGAPSPDALRAMPVTDPPTAALGAGTLSTRDLSIDAARGMAMLLIVLGHNVAFSRFAPPAVSFIFLFHVPAFFVISGYLLQSRALNVAKLALRILWPLLAVGLAFTLVKSMARGEDIGLALAGLVWGTGATLPSSQLWFLPALFLTLIGANLIARSWGGKPNMLTVGGSLSVLTILGWIGLHLPAAPVEALRRPDVDGAIGWMWSIDLVPVALLYCMGGYLLRRAKLDLPVWIAGIMALLLAGLYLMGVRTNINERVMDPYFLSLVGGGAGALMLLSIGTLMRGRDPISSAVQTVGQRSMSILLFHILVQNAVVQIASGKLPAPYAQPVAIASGFAFGVLGPICLSMLYEAALKRVPKSFRV